MRLPGALVLLLLLSNPALAQLSPMRLPRSLPQKAEPPAPKEKMPDGSIEVAAADPPALRFTVPGALADACERLGQQPVPKRRDDASAVQESLESFLHAIVATEVKDLTAMLGLRPYKDEASSVDRANWLTGTCAAVFARVVADAANHDSFAGHEALVRTHQTLSRVKKWQRSLATGSTRTPSLTSASDQLSEAQDSLNTVMKAHGLMGLVSAAVFAGGTVGSNGLAVRRPLGDTKNSVTVPETNSTVPVSLIKVETTHWGWEGESTFDISVRSSFGFKPVDTLAVVSEKVDSALTSAPSVAKAASIASLTRPALYSAFGLRAGAYSKRNIEISLATQTTVARLTDEKVLVDPGSPDTLVGQLPTGANRTAWAWELGGEVNFFDNPLTVIHAERGVATPAVSFAGGYRWDSRFRPVGELKDLQLKGPEKRLYFRAMFDALKVLDPRTDASTPKTFDFGFGVEYERAVHRGDGTHVPSITRWILRGDINLLSATKKEESAKK